MGLICRLFGHKYEEAGVVYVNGYIVELFVCWRCDKHDTIRHPLKETEMYWFSDDEKDNIDYCVNGGGVEPVVGEMVYPRN